MANVAHLIRRQSSRDLNRGPSLDRMELKEMRGKLILEQRACAYGSTNQAFEDSSPPSVKVEREFQEKPVFKAEEEEERESWDSKVTFLLATVGYAVGLGNVWRFPYLAQKNGGGAFLVPYFIMLLVEGVPIFYLELAVGQRLRKGAVGAWNQVSPYLSGIGVSSAVVSFNVALYYNTIIAWCLFYFARSFEAVLPWSDCPKKFFDNGSYVKVEECELAGPTRYFWYRTTLQVSEEIDSPAPFNFHVALALLAAWILVYLCMVKGITSSGKVVYVTATFPYLVLIIFFFRGVTLRGAGDGLRHLFTPAWHRLLDPVVWLEAGTQTFFSLGLAFGGLIAFSSYNPVNNNCYRDAVIVSATNCFTSLFAGVVVFSVIGFRATLSYEKCLSTRNLTSDNLPECDLQKELDNSASGTGLAFIVFTDAINQFPGLPQLWSLLFFLMLFTLGIDSQFGTLEGVATSVGDMRMLPAHWTKSGGLTAILCGMCCVLSMVFANGAGSYIFVLFDGYVGNFPLLIIAFCECVGVSYVYGLKRFADDIEMMTGSRPGLYWLICWKYLSPLAMLSILIASVVEIIVDGSGYQAWQASTGTTERKPWPIWCILLVAVLVLGSVLWIPGAAIARLFGFVLIEDNEKAWFPANELKEFHGIMPHDVTTAEKILFCIREDGTEGLCCPTGYNYDGEEEDI